MTAWNHHRNGTQPTSGRLQRRTIGSVSEEYVRCIRSAHANGAAISSLQRLFPKLKRSALYAIINCTAWKHVK